MINFRKVVLLGTVASSALVLSACGLYGGSTNTGTGQTNGTTPETVESPVAGNVITYSESGFSPKQLTVKVGESVEFVNNSSSNVQVNSAPHPTHELYPELNIGVIAPGETKSVTFTTAGTKTYHNHLNPSQNGQVTVE
ncbi:MAG: hypothetical protein UU05_C0029G0015 [Candidatus Curtissbacteria bacterium GW2011_GWA1_40_47]|uniref:EfeO-type cupredoxin-like domain-containing protein n=1 Tax=Candidatus Curtissbacteria bacterium RIFOXYA1_FULL_41_14 TaxID=1797737 RepID=A0A1F5HB96_9BACT|nr:MAG: hypothetical protein UT95_C0016G0011 [Candidatus Curtissbacteria bacterium GW2011_GWB1_40_28]KKR61397.1 MAG: hypothetical protein UU00_C0014G0009 [Microgenomates group bacterium GW2011_GWC1_40_35]KKR65073.1 MAG: hypothetical protein UU05_C0029G0015 [Candidatus Curtissbacteria bacterium GW2011_GWA1_40_47]KKS02101.1 MAG: hypothetical protein UU53_C0004G0049 [Candidatus Curtissbacteria bacterium GW2011_GWC2_41_21]OGD81302.1 MAG: hypothetical protein A2683_01040 [Candidatus Curtissbacteria 